MRMQKKVQNGRVVLHSTHLRTIYSREKLGPETERFGKGSVQKVSFPFNRIRCALGIDMEKLLAGKMVRMKLNISGYERAARGHLRRIWRKVIGKIL